MSRGPTNETADRPGDDAISAVARGGLLNLVGLLVYGGANFALVFVVTLRFGAEGAGTFLVPVGIYTIAQKVTELGAVTGVVRFVSSFRATGRDDEVGKILSVALVPVVIFGTVAAGGLYLAAGSVARIVSDGDTSADVAAVLRAMVPFLCVSGAYMVVVQGTRGFGAMAPTALLERAGRSSFQLIAAVVVSGSGGGPEAVGRAWALSYAVFLVPAVLTFRRLLHRSQPVAHVEPAPSPAPGAGSVTLRREFWRFTLPRSGGQLFEAGVQWGDTLIIGALISTEAAGIYGAGSRFLLLAVYVVDALTQVVSPHLSGLLARRRTREASEVLRVAAGWQTLLVWPTYLTVFVFASVFLSALGDEFVAAEAPLRWLCLAALLVALSGPSVAVVLMGGRSSLALANTGISFTVNIVGNLVMVPRFGIAGAGAVWALTLVVAATLPAIEAMIFEDVRPWAWATLRVAATAAVTVGVSALVARLLLGDTVIGLAVALLVGGSAYFAVVLRRSDELRLRELVGGRTPADAR